MLPSLISFASFLHCEYIKAFDHQMLHLRGAGIARRHTISALL